MSIPNAEAYKKALSKAPISSTQLAMLKAHFEAPNRSITYTELAKAAGYESYVVANRQYGQLGRDIGEAIGFEFIEAEARPGEKFYSSSLGMPTAYTTGDLGTRPCKLLLAEGFGKLELPRPHSQAGAWERANEQTSEAYRTCDCRDVLSLERRQQEEETGPA